MAGKKSDLRFDDYVRGIARLRPDEQLSLIEVISSRLKKTMKGRKAKHSIMELEGLGAHIWKGVDIRGYLSEERKSWD